MALRVPLIMLALLAAVSVSSPVPSPDAVALLAFKSACAVHGTTALDSWTESSDPCSGEWRGVTCHRPSSPGPPRVRGIVLEGLGLGGDAGALAALADLPALSFLSLKKNNFTGPLHDVDFSAMAPHLKLLYLSGNAFSGRFPQSILRLRHLRRLDLAGNRLAGTIPPEIGHRLRALVTLRLARNSFVGSLPTSLEAMAMLAELNVSGNHLSGQIPKRLAAAFPASSFAGNPELCGAPLRRRCRRQQQGGDGETTHEQMGTRHNSRYRWMVVMIMAAVGAAVATLIATALCAVLWWKKKKKPTPPRANSRTSSTSASREETVRFDGCCEEFDVRALMMGAAEMLGKGAAATTYRVFMGGQSDVNDDHAGVVEKTEGEAVVVKRLRRREGATREDERRRRELVREMGSWRHANIVDLRAFYASAEELLLVFDYIPHGSLHSLLHENRGPARVPLDWQTRLKLAQDAAQGLAYLHGASGSRLSHRHLTSSNILIDAGGNARVSDFAMLQLLVPAPPEKALQKQDVRDFGVILLEILTGRSPEDGKVDMPRWVRTVVREEWTSEVFDMELLRGRGAEDEMVALLQVALLCAADDPKERPRMAVVSKMIEDIRNRGSKRSKYSASPSQAGCSYESSPCVSEDTTKSTTASSS
ncbi:probable leucine-rich repeat receptor-like protein kinase At1g68400 [Lolium rigidum]|uniref:probable leucine-rich repeat receptor-like protein kinase At1g68400 n=1 Tax=Lolium rigidum TaxID=89674 RepID=UPI001F5CBB8B|nr:probable leucine-rich repeat receptor-like protein kinase At1g68400 [Lolium rigidum]